MLVSLPIRSWTPARRTAIAAGGASRCGGPGATRPGRGGQVAVEWLMVAGILTAVAIILTGMFQPVLVSVVRMVARGVRTVGL